MARLILHGNNRAAAEIALWLKTRGESIVGLVLHPPAKRSYGEAISKAVNLSNDFIFDGSQIKTLDFQQRIQRLNPSFGISVYFGYMLPSDYLALFPNGCFNLHPALLPYNRGAYPNVWSLIDNTPAGVSLHAIDGGIDTGAIYAQREVIKKPWDTGFTLYQRLEDEAIQLFKDSWESLRDGKLAPQTQSADEGTVHRVSDVAGIDEIALDKTYKAQELLNILRARTYPPYKGAYFMHENRKVYLRLELEPETSHEKN